MHPAAPVLLLAAAAGASAPLPAAEAQDRAGVAIAQLTIRERIIIRVPATRNPAAAVAAPVPIRWVEKKGPKCIAADQLAGAIVNGGDSIDLVLKGGSRVRAQLADDCDGLGSYGGFYLKPSADGQVCTGRDMIRTRLGDSCGIRHFRKLVAKR